MTDDVKLPEPTAWMVSPYGTFKANHLVRVTAPKSLEWRVPIYDEPTVRRLIAEAVEREREACAVLCEARRDRDLDHGHISHAAAADDCARAIRNRSNA